jgi:hypothetical protein
MRCCYVADVNLFDEDGLNKNSNLQLNEALHLKRAFLPSL